MTLADSAGRLAAAGVNFIELHGNHYGPDLGYKPDPKALDRLVNKTVSYFRQREDRLLGRQNKGKKIAPK
ncbi:MAG: hypothetical protein SVT52_05070 [Planctomycetota bacterium]|nr:hypothetical protein [Planctomycetota bacterium]